MFSKSQCKRESRHAVHTAEVLRWRAKQLLNSLIKKYILSSLYFVFYVCPCSVLYRGKRKCFQKHSFLWLHLIEEGESTRSTWHFLPLWGFHHTCLLGPRYKRDMMTHNLIKINCLFNKPVHHRLIQGIWRELQYLQAVEVSSPTENKFA